ncbi:hypothetical protein M0R45_001908 [Rubus argutus]|uniref:DUF4283 domain-containing protein n=1 Tax=Rubus argutus TaxID=59490 RepID=A0AAW1VGE7_RUBAR
MASIDAVTTSFVASLAIAGGGEGPLDLEKLSGGTIRRSSQSFLLGKVLHSKPLDSSLVLRGGAWSFGKAPVILEEYDGMLPLVAVPMRHLRFWVKVEGISPTFEEPVNFKLIGDLLGGYLDYDKMMLRQGVEALLKFTYEHLIGRCKKCSLLSHVGEQCSLVSDDDPSEGSERVKLFWIWVC